jgi:GT2 family glycosyltransferase
MADRATYARPGPGVVTATVPVTVVVPTIERPELLRACLASVAACEPRAAEILVIDQSGGGAIRSVVEQFEPAGARVVTSSVANKSLALNLGLAEACHEVVLVTDDDCTVAASWAGAAWKQMQRDPSAIVTGRVLPSGEPLAVPSTIEEVIPHDYSGEKQYGALYGGNMACNPSLVLAAGGFDERLSIAEDNDFCYRWLRAGRPLRYEPELVVWHHAWRTRDEMNRLHRSYGHGQGLFYAKHLRRRDLGVVPFLTRDLYRGARGVAARMVRGDGEWPDPRKGLLSGLLVGLFDGWRTFSPRATRSTAVGPLAPGDDGS